MLGKIRIRAHDSWQSGDKNGGIQTKIIIILRLRWMLDFKSEIVIFRLSFESNADFNILI